MDRRQIKTKKAILDAFEHLLKKKSYNKITVKEIIDEANIGRTTFYDHFDTKDAVLDEVCDTLFDHVFYLSSDVKTMHHFSFNNSDVKTIITHLLYHLKEDQQAITRLLIEQNCDQFLYHFKAYIQSFTTIPNTEMVMDGIVIPQDFIRSQLSASFINLMQWWIAHGMKESPEQLANYYCALYKDILY